MDHAHLLAYDCINGGAISDLLLSHHNWPLLLPEDHEGVEWLFHIRMVFVSLVEMLRETAVKRGSK